MNLAQGGEPLSVMSREVGVDPFVGGDTEELADDLHGQDLRVGELRGRAALTNAAFLELVVDEAEDADYESVKIHESGGLLCFGWFGHHTERREVSLFIQPFIRNLHTGLAIRHRGSSFVSQTSALSWSW